MAKLFKRGNVWCVTYYQNGRRHRKSLGKDRKQAVEAFNEIAYRLSRNEFVQGSRIPISAYKKEFLEFVKSRNSEKTFHNYSIILNHFERYLNEEEGVKNVQDVNMGIIDRFVSYRLESESPQRKGRTIDRSTVNTELKYIKRFFNRAVELGYIMQSPAKKIRLLSTVRRNPRFFRESEVAAILDECGDEWVRDIYITLLYTGLRIGELVNLEWDDIDLIRRNVVVRPKELWNPKGKEERSIPMHEVVFCILVNMERKSNWVFTKADRGKVNIHSLEARFRKQLRRMGIQGVNLHIWRHTFASYITMRSGNIRAVQKLLGHKSIRTTEIYSHLSDKHLFHQVFSLFHSVPHGLTKFGQSLVTVLIQYEVQ